MSNINTRVLNDAVLNQLTSSDDRMEKSAKAAITDYTRTKMREDGFARRILPPETVTDADLDRQVDTAKPVIIIDREPDSPAAQSVPFATLPNNRYIQGDRYRVMFDRIETPRYTSDINALRTYDMDIRKILADNSIKDMLAEEDGKFISVCDQIAGTVDVANADSGGVHYKKIVDATGPITRESLAASMKTMPRLKGRLTPEKTLVNNITIWDIVAFGRDELGGDLAQDLLLNGFSERVMLGVTWLITIKVELVADNTMYHFAAPKYLGKFFILEDATMFIKREAFMLEFYAYESIGCTIGNITGVTKTLFATS
jgi:hypothetical protein